MTLGTQSLTCTMDLEKPRTYFMVVKVVQSFPRKSSKITQSYKSERRVVILSKTRSNELTFIKTLHKNLFTLYLLMESSNIFTCRFCKAKTCDKETSTSISFCSFNTKLFQYKFFQSRCSSSHLA